MKYLKFEFQDKADMLTKLAPYFNVDEEGNHYPNHLLVGVVEGIPIVKVPGEYDENGNTITEPVMGDKYAVDVIFRGTFPYNLAEEIIVDGGGKKIIVKNADGEEIEIDSMGAHTFGGFEYLYDERRIEKNITQ
tara:strand:+ start:81 stop:482 length:402 start_codon:yes stop_codon:yes gene_type:complete